MSQISFGTITIVDTTDIQRFYVEYAKSNSSAAAPTTGWSQNRPTWQNGTYIWQRTVMKKQDVAQLEYGNPVCITGEKGQTGQQGIQGNTGKGISSIVTTYCNYGTGTPAANYSGWNSNVPEYDKNKPNYWVKTTVNYTTGNPSVTIYKDLGITEAAQKANFAASVAQTAESNSLEAISIAGSKNKIYYSTSFPTEGSYIDGDTLFYKTSNGTIMYVYDSSYNDNTSGHWRQQQFEENAISDLAITNAKIKNLNGDKIIANTIASDKIVSHSITAVQLATNAIKSTNYNAGTAPYSLTGTFLDLSNGNIFTPNFGVNNDSTDNIDNGAYIKGTIQAYDGKIGSDNNNYWYIGNYFDYNQGQSAMIRSHGTAAIQLGDSSTWRLSTNRIHTAWNDDSTSGQAFRLHYLSYDGKYWDSGLHVPTSATDKLLYIRNAPTSTSLENLQNDIDDNSGGNYWNYQFYLTNDGSVYAKNIYIVDENGNTTQIGGTDGVYLLKSGGTITGNLTVNGTLTATASQANALTHTLSINGQSWTGSSNLTINTLGTAYGGTGNTSYTAGGVVYADNSSPKKLLSTAAGTSGYLLKSGGTGAPTWVDPGTLTVAAAAKDGDGNVIKTTYLKLTGGNVTGPVSFGDSVSIDDLNAGTLVVTGNASFTNNIQANTINGVTVGSSPKFTDTTYTFDNGYSASNNKGATVLTVTNAIGALNVNPINGATNKTLTSISETAGKISATYSNISITKAQVSDFPTSMPASDVSAWAKASTKPSYNYSEIQPLLAKTYTGVIATANDQNNGALYFIKIQPQNYGKTWSIRYRVTATIDGVSVANGSGYESSQVYLNGMRDTYSSYSTWNDITNTSYRPYYYHCFYRAKEAGITNGYGHALGIHLRYSYNPTTAANSRTVTFEIMEVEGCTVTFLDEPLTYSNWPGTGSTNYNTYTNFDATTYGMTESGDRNDPNYYNRTYYSSRITSAALYRYQFCLTKSDGTLVPINSVNNSVATNKTLTIDSFDPFGEIFYWNSTGTASANANVGDGSLYRQYLCDLRYSFNCGGYDTTPTLTARMPLYLVATPQEDGTAKLYIEPLSMYLPSSEDGLIYIYLGKIYPDTKPYRIALSLNHPIYEYRNGAVRLYTGLKSETAASGGTNVSLVTTGQKYLWNSKTNNTGTVTSVAASGSGGITISGSPITTSGTLAIGLNLSTAINGLGEGTSAANRNDYAVVQYAGGGTTTTSYHRRKLSNVFKALIADDIPNLAWSKITSGNDDLKAIEALEGTSGLLKKTAANTWSLDTTSYVPTSRTINGHALSNNVTVSKEDVGLGSVANALQIKDIGSNDAGQLVLTYGDDTTATRTVSITATTSSSVAKAEALNTNGVKIGDSNKPVYFGTDGKPVAINYTIEKSVPADAIFPKFEGTYNDSTNKAATVSTVTNAINALDGNLNNTTPGAGKTLTAFSQTDGKISATFGNISITKSQISDFPSTLTPAAHTHGNISNTGIITSTTIALGNGDNLLFADSSNSGKIERSSITIGTGTSKYLRQDGTWGTPAGTYSLPVATDSTRGGVKIGYTTSGKNYAVQLSSEKMYVNVPWSDTTYSAGTGLNLSGTTFNHSNSITAGTVGTSSATNGATLAVPYITYDAQGHVTGKGTHTHTINNIPQADITWGGPALAGNASPNEVATIDDLAHNKFAFMSAASIAVHFSRDGGATWVSYGTDAGHRRLVTLSEWFKIGGPEAGESATVNDQLRIQLNANIAGGNVYCFLHRILIYLTTSGSSGSTCTVQYKTIANYNNNNDTWTTLGTYNVAGWSGWNSIPFSGFFGGSSTQTGQIAQIRLIFKVTGVSSSSTNLAIGSIRGIAFPLWVSPSTMASTGHLYTFDIDQNATFPAKVTATEFIGNLAWSKITSKPTTLSGYGITDSIKWQTSTTAATNIYDFGVYVARGTGGATGPTNENYYTMLNIPYRKAFGNTKADYSWSIAGSTSNDNRLFYRTSNADTWGDWVEIAHINVGTAVGNATQPVYVTNTGVVTACTPYANASVNYATSAGSATSATKTGTSAIWLYANNNNEINFGGTNTGTLIYMGYRATDSRPIPTKFIFGGSTGTADLQAKTVYLGSGTTSYITSTQYTGNAATATKATQDGNGNVITTKYVTIDTTQTISGRKTFNDLAAVTFKPSSGTDECNINYDATLGALVFSF